MFHYGEVCPISRATGVLCERWILQIIREMLLDAARFSDSQKYLPKLSPTLLNARLRSLEENGVIVRRKMADKKRNEYLLTPSGKALEPVLSELGKWGIKWVFDGMDDEQLNMSVIVRDFAGAMDLSQLPSGSTTIQFSICGEEGTTKKYVLVRDGKSQVCDENPGHDVDVYLSANLKTLYGLWFGEISHNAACKQDLLKVVGAPVYSKNLSQWLRTSQFAKVNKNYCG